MLRRKLPIKFSTSPSLTRSSPWQGGRVLSTTAVCAKKRLDSASGADDHPDATTPRPTLASVLSSQNQGTWSTLEGALRSSQRPQANTPNEPPVAAPVAAPVPVSEAPNTTSAPATKRKSTQRRKTLKDNAEWRVKVINPAQLDFQPIEDPTQPEPPRLSHGLERVLFNPGVYQLRDQRSGVYNFDPYLGSLMENDEFDFDALGEFITSSKDVKLMELTKKHNKKYFTSTSSSTAILSHFHYLLSSWRPPSFDNLSKSLYPESTQYTGISRAPAASFLRYKDGVYALDADKQFDTENVLSLMGKSMEKLLTLPKDEFEMYRRDKSHNLSEETKNAREAYHYTTLGDFVLRSQLDAKDPRLPGTGVFDLKTRAVITIRMDVTGYEKGQGYEIRKLFGQWESFEREYYDMIRAAFLKYSLQARMGRMDGIFVAYHNTRRIFGFQYIPIEELDQILHGTSNKKIGDGEFRASLKIFNDLLDKATKKFPGRTLRIHVETRPTQIPLLYFFAEPVTEEEVDRVQAKNADTAKRLSKEFLDRTQQATAEETAGAELEDSEPDNEGDDLSGVDADRAAVWEEMMLKVDAALEDEIAGTDTIRQAVRDALDHRSLLVDKSDPEIERELDAIVEALTAEISLSNQAAGSRDGRGSEMEEEEEEEFNQSREQDQGLEPHEPSEESKTESVIAEGQVDEADMINKQLQQWAQSGITEDVTGGTANDSLNTSKDPSNAANSGESASGSMNLEESEASDAKKDMSLSALILKATEDITAKNASLRPLERAFADILRRSGSNGAETTEEPGTAHDEEDSAQQPSTADGSGSTESALSEEKEILGLYVTTRHRVGGEYVTRPEAVEDGKKMPHWSVEYSIGEMPKAQAKRIHQQMRARRKKLLSGDPRQQDQRWHMMFGGQLSKLSKEGVKQRRAVAKADKKRGKVYGAWSSEPLEHSGENKD